MSESDEQRSERVQRIKEERRRLHALRLIQNEDQIKAKGLLDQDTDLSRFNKYRRSGRSETTTSSSSSSAPPSKEDASTTLSPKDESLIKEQLPTTSTLSSSISTDSRSSSSRRVRGEPGGKISYSTHLDKVGIKKDEKPKEPEATECEKEDVESKNINNRHDDIKLKSSLFETENTTDTPPQTNDFGLSTRNEFGGAHGGRVKQISCEESASGASNSKNSMNPIFHPPVSSFSEPSDSKSSLTPEPMDKLPVDQTKQMLLEAEKEFELLYLKDQIEVAPEVPPIVILEGDGEASVGNPRKKKTSILKKNSDHSNAVGQQVSFDSTSSILPSEESNDFEGSGILKRSPSDKDKERDHRSILKNRRSSLESSEGGIQGILKRKHSYDSSVISKEWNSAASALSLSTHSLPSCGSPSPEPKPILKKKSSSEDLDDDRPDDPKPILKNRDRSDSCGESSSKVGIKPCLKKKGTSFSPESQDDGERLGHGRGILKKGGILKGSSTHSSSDNVTNSENPNESGDTKSNEKHPKFNLPEDLNHRASYPFSLENMRLHSSLTYENGSSNTTGNRQDQRRVSEPPNPTHFDSDNFLFGSATEERNKRLNIHPHSFPNSETGSNGIEFEHNPSCSSSSASIKCSSGSSLPPIQDFLNAKAQLERGKPPTPFTIKSSPNSDEFPQRVLDQNILIDTPKVDLIARLGSSSEYNKVERSDSQEEIIMSLSVADKRSLFLQMEQRKYSADSGLVRSNSSNESSSKVKRSTQPVTSDEIELASKGIGEDESGGSLKEFKGSRSFNLSDELSKISDNATTSGASDRNSKNWKKCRSESPRRSLDFVLGAPTGKPPTGWRGEDDYCAKLSLRPYDENMNGYDSTPFDHNLGLDSVDQIEEFEPTNLSFQERLQMFNAPKFDRGSFRPTASFRRPNKKPVTSKRFRTLPITKSEHRQVQGNEKTLILGESKGLEHEEGQKKEMIEESEYVRNESTLASPRRSSISKEGSSGESSKARSPSSPPPPSNSPQVNLVGKMQEKIILRDSPPPPGSAPESPEEEVADTLSDGSLSDSPLSPSAHQLRSTSSSSESSEKEEEAEAEEEGENMLKGGEEMSPMFVGKLNRNSIAERVQALKTNGELNWKKRVSKEVLDIDKIQTDEVDHEKVVLRNKDEPNNFVAVRLSLLENAKEGWKKRVSENESKAFTVQGKLERAGKLLKKDPSHLSENRKSSAPLKSRSEIIDPGKRDRRTEEEEKSSGESHSFKENKYQRSFSLPQPKSSENCPEKGGGGGEGDVGGQVEEGDEKDRIITIVQNDNETFTKFFNSSTASLVDSGRRGSLVQIEDSSFEAIQSDSSHRQLLGLRKNVRGPRRTHGEVRNPIKSLNFRMNVQEQCYSELNPLVREKEMKKRIQIEKLSKQSHLAVEALRGLASKEDFTAVRLKKGANGPKRDFPHPMLLRIKGKRLVQTRLVPPVMESLSSGDNFILVTPDKLFQFIGEFSNRMERQTCCDIISHITKKKGLGCRLSSPGDVIKLEEPLIGAERDLEKFVSILGGGERILDDEEKLGDDYDEAFELGINKFNRVYILGDSPTEITKKSLFPLKGEGGWGNSPKYSLLKDDRILVFDFGSEMYVWSGSRAHPEAKKEGFQLAKELFEAGYDFGDGDIEFSPIPGSLKGSKRPDWTWLSKVNQHMEPILFTEKFFDWPQDSARLIKVQQLKKTNSGSERGAAFNFEACDIDEMKRGLEVEEPGLELENFNVRRGKDVYDELEFRAYQIGLIGLKTWHVSNEFSKNEIDSTSIGHFYSGGTYVVKWTYRVSQITRDLKGNMSKFPISLGRERSAYFYWQGKDSSITEQGTSALMTVELDQEKGPQIRVIQGKEPPAFLQLFKGLLFIHSGEEERARKREMRLFIAFGEHSEDEGHFFEIACEPSSFRSKGSFLFVNSNKGIVYVWHGAHSSLLCRKIALNGGKYIEGGKGHFQDMGRHKLIEIEEGKEPKEFLASLGCSNQTKWTLSYDSLLGKKKEDYERIEAFHFSSLSGNFEAFPLLSPKRSSKEIESFPILQEDLFSVQQPSLFLVSNGSTTWLWQGAKPRGDDENDNMSTGSIDLRWTAERRRGIETCLAYAKRRGTDALLVHAGLEPKSFTNMFPYWVVNDEARETHLSEGKEEGGVIKLEEAIKMYLKSVYTIEELRRAERPEGVDLLKLETYLSDEDFQECLKMSRDEFSKLQAWKKSELKKSAGLF